MTNTKKIAIAAGVTVILVGGWALFRPELLFINQKVNEAAPTTQSASTTTIAKGSFKSYAHESSGDAVIIKTGNAYTLRLENFKTSNGPDVHVYLVKGTDASQDGVNKNGFLDLKPLKGNEGDQNYDLPADFDLKTYGGVSIWCKRFGVAFAGATLTPSATALVRPQAPLSLASFSPEILVTSGKLSGQAKGNASLVETGGKRFIRLKGLKLPKGNFQVLLVKAEGAKTTSEIKSAEKIILGTPHSGTVMFQIGDKVDACLYRTVSIWNPKTKKSIAIAHLRSAQENKQMLFTI